VINHFPRRFIVGTALFLLAGSLPSISQTETVIEEFQGNSNEGSYPDGALVSGVNGTLYGATSGGNYGVTVVGTTVYGTTIWRGTGVCQIPEGTVGCGTVFQITQ
jgi:hypothetical protein